MPRVKVKCASHKCENLTRPDSSTGLCRECFDGGVAASTKDEAPKPAPAVVVEGLDVSGNKALVNLTVPAKVKTLEELIAVCEIDTDVWEVERYTCQALQQGSVPRPTGTSGNWSRPSAEVVVTQLYNVKAWLRRKVELIGMRDEIAALLEDAASRAPRPLPVHHALGDGERHMLMPSIPDLHVGKLAWGPETGGANYDSRIAIELYHQALFKLVERTGAFQVGRIVLPIGNDLINSDNVQLTTTRGTPQSSDGRWHKTFRAVRRMLSGGIDFLRQVAPVHVVVVPGNHDTQSMWSMGELLRAMYFNDQHVTFDNEPVLWKFLEFERNMFMFLHGDKGRKANYPNVMARLQKDMWGRTEHREIHTGHLHTTKVDELHGTKLIISPALCPPDAWHAENLYVGNARAAEAFVYHPEEGRVAAATYTVQEARC